VLSEIAALGEARGRDQRDQRKSSDKCLHDTSPWFRIVVRESCSVGNQSPFAAAGMIACCARQICAKSHPIIVRCLEGPFRISEQSGTDRASDWGARKTSGRIVSEAAGCDDLLDHLYTL
jgi:hypothetical protein